MKKLNRIVIALFLFNMVVLLIAIKLSYALNNDITSSTYEIIDNKIYAVPTTYNYRVEELLSNIESTSEIKVLNSNNEELKNGDYISNGSKVIANNTTYEIILLGDITGDGKIQLSDISLLYNVYKSKQTLNEERIESGKLTDYLRDNCFDPNDEERILEKKPLVLTRTTDDKNQINFGFRS